VIFRQPISVFAIGYFHGRFGYARPPLPAEPILKTWPFAYPRKVTMKDHLRTYARHFVRALAEAGSLPPTQELQPLMGPNAALMWTEAAPIRREQPHSDDRPPTTDSLAVPTTDHTRTDILRPEPLDNSLEAPAV
jgi:hypothetical protein